MTFIKVTDLKAGYDHNAILCDLNFEIAKGDFLGIVGPNGAGKSTLVKTLTSQIKPLSGSIMYAKEHLKCGYLAQHNLTSSDFPASVYEVISSGCLNTLDWLPFYKANAKKKIASIMEFLDLIKIKHECYRNLSGGQQRLVLLGRALCASQDMLILDEPNAGLDVNASQKLYETIQKINKNLALTIIMISHDFNSLHNCQHILHLDRGQKFFGSFKDYQNEAICQHFWGNR